MGNTEKNGTVGAFDKAGSFDTSCILLGDVDPTAEKLYRSDNRHPVHLHYHLITLAKWIYQKQYSHFPNLGTPDTLMLANNGAPGDYQYL